MYLNFIRRFIGVELPAFSTPGVVVNPQGAASFSIDSLLCEPDCVVEGDTGEIEVFLDNEYEAGGFQMNLTFDTEILDYIQINPKPRTEGFQLSAALNGNTLIILCFSLTEPTFSQVAILFSELIIVL